MLLDPHLSFRPSPSPHARLQILANVAIIVVDEMDPGTVAFQAWTVVLHVADVLAAVAVLLPIVWFIRQLKNTHEGNRMDDKTADTLARLEQFQSFYVMTIGYLYVTRIIVYLLGTILPYTLLWFAPFTEEVVTLAYYAVVGRRFRPLSEATKYLRVPVDDDGPPATADGGDVEMVQVSDCPPPLHPPPPFNRPSPPRSPAARGHFRRGGCAWGGSRRNAGGGCGGRQDVGRVRAGSRPPPDGGQRLAQGGCAANSSGHHGCGRHRGRRRCRRPRQERRAQRRWWGCGV